MDKHHKFIGDMDPDLRGVFFAFTTISIALTNENPGARDRLISYLLDLVARMPEDERSSPYALSLASMIEVMESTQFPDPPSGRTP